MLVSDKCSLRRYLFTTNYTIGTALNRPYNAQREKIIGLFREFLYDTAVKEVDYAVGI